MSMGAADVSTGAVGGGGGGGGGGQRLLKQRQRRRRRAALVGAACRDQLHRWTALVAAEVQQFCCGSRQWQCD